MATHDLNSLAKRLMRAVVGGASGKRRHPYVFNIGLDFGTAFTKCIIRDINNNAAYPLFVRIGENFTFLIPSEVRISAGRLCVPLDPDAKGEPLAYLKMALAAIVEPHDMEAWLRNVEGALPREWRSNPFQHIEAITAYFLSRVLREAMNWVRTKAPDFGQISEDRCFINMAVPVGHAQHPKIEKAFLTAVQRACILLKLLFTGVADTQRTASAALDRGQSRVWRWMPRNCACNALHQK